MYVIPDDLCSRLSGGISMTINHTILSTGWVSGIQVLYRRCQPPYAFPSGSNERKGPCNLCNNTDMEFCTGEMKW